MHTPGPWTVDVIVNNRGALIVMEAQAHYRWNRGQSQEELDREFTANARLIAAAPTLLEALKNLARYAMPNTETVIYREQALEAIAHAEGTEGGEDDRDEPPVGPDGSR